MNRNDSHKVVRLISDCERREGKVKSESKRHYIYHIKTFYTFGSFPFGFRGHKKSSFTPTFLFTKMEGASNPLKRVP